MQLSASAQKVQDILAARGCDSEVRELPASTRTAAEAADAIGCTVAQIVKSLVFRGADSGKAILVLASGANRVDVDAVAAHAGEALEKADADFVRENTGFAIGGIPPLGYGQPLDTWIDSDLLQYETLWAAAGTPHAVFSLASKDVVELTHGQVIPVKDSR